jgi:DNA topoisomerase IA
MPPVKALFVAEKNSVAKAIANALGGGTRINGASQMNPITECKGQIGAIGSPPCAADIRVTSVQGHLMELEFKVCICVFSLWRFLYSNSFINHVCLF